MVPWKSSPCSTTSLGIGYIDSNSSRIVFNSTQSNQNICTDNKIVTNDLVHFEHKIEQPLKGISDIVSESSSFHKDVWSEECVSRTAELWELSPVLRDRFVELGQRLRDVSMYTKNNPADVIRFFIANSGNINKAEIQFRNMLVWRDHHHVDQILNNYYPPLDVVNNFPGAVLKGLDKDGDPIFVSRVGVTDAAAMLQRYGHDEMIKHSIWLRELLCTGEWMKEYEQTHKRPVKRAIVIEDVDELPLFHIVSNRPLLSLYAEIMRLDQDNYPEAAKKIIILRAPALFRLVWNIVQHFFDINVREKMIFTSRSNYRTVLAEYMDLTVLPNCIVPGIGVGTPLDGMPPNFEGGPLPPL